MGTITRKFHQNPLKTVGGVAETRLCLRTDRRTDGRTDRQTHYYSPFRLMSRDNKTQTANFEGLPFTHFAVGNPYADREVLDATLETKTFTDGYKF